MLGNFSFQVTSRRSHSWAWEFLTKELEIPADRLYISVYQEDDEAYDIWTKEVGIPRRSHYLVWAKRTTTEMAPAPGPCSEIYYDRGPSTAAASRPTASVMTIDRFMEIWNLVFSQYDADGKGNYELLAKPNIDTGMGPSVWPSYMQDVNNLSRSMPLPPFCFTSGASRRSTARTRRMTSPSA